MTPADQTPRSLAEWVSDRLADPAPIEKLVSEEDLALDADAPQSPSSPQGMRRIVTAMANIAPRPGKSRPPTAFERLAEAHIPVAAWAQATDTPGFMTAYKRAIMRLVILPELPNMLRASVEVAKAGDHRQSKLILETVEALAQGDEEGEIKQLMELDDENYRSAMTEVQEMISGAMEEFDGPTTLEPGRVAVVAAKQHQASIVQQPEAPALLDHDAAHADDGDAGSA